MNGQNPSRVVEDDFGALCGLTPEELRMSLELRELTGEPHGQNRYRVGGRGALMSTTAGYESTFQGQMREKFRRGVVRTEIEAQGLRDGAMEWRVWPSWAVLSWAAGDSEWVRERERLALESQRWTGNPRVDLAPSGLMTGDVWTWPPELEPDVRISGLSEFVVTAVTSNEMRVGPENTDYRSRISKSTNRNRRRG